MDSHDNIFQLCYQGNYNIVKVKLDENPILIIQKDDNCRFLSHWAALGGHYELLQLLLDRGCPYDAPDDMGITPLILSASAGKKEVVHVLISKGANLNQKNNQGHSALQYACSKGWIEIASMLIKNGAEVNIADNQGATPLHRAASLGNTAIVKLILKSPDVKVDQKDNSGFTALHLACEDDCQEEARLLVQQGADLNLINKEGKTPINLASPTLMKMLNLIPGDGIARMDFT